MRWLRAVSAASFVLGMGAQACDERSEANPNGAAGNSAGGSAEYGGQANVGGDGGTANCRASHCEPRTLVGECPATAPELYDPCTTFGSSCVYCANAATCGDDHEPFIAECCMFSGVLVWSHDCLLQCPLSESQKKDTLGRSNGAGGEDGAGSLPSADGADAAQGCLLAQPASCCTLDRDCPIGFECAHSVDGFASVCKPKLSDSSRCWQSSDCSGDGTCEGALFCDCTTECNDEYDGACVDGAP